jgi:hypothetical protein
VRAIACPSEGPSSFVALRVAPRLGREGGGAGRSESGVGSFLERLCLMGARGGGAGVRGRVEMGRTRRRGERGQGAGRERRSRGKSRDMFVVAVVRRKKLGLTGMNRDAEENTLNFRLFTTTSDDQRRPR